MYTAEHNKIRYSFVRVPTIDFAEMHYLRTNLKD